MKMFRLVQGVKTKVVPKGRKPRRILGGLNRGLRMQLDLDSRTQLWLGSFENETTRFYRDARDRIATAIDVGAADGYYTLYFLARSSAQMVVAFEPQASLRALIADNLTLNRIDPSKRLKVFAEMVSDQDSDGSKALDSVLGLVDTPCFIKIDIEGAEGAALRGSERLLAMDQVSWLVETHSAASEEECLKIFKEASYETEIIPNVWWRAYLPEGRHGPHNRWLFAVRSNAPSS